MIEPRHEHHSQTSPPASPSPASSASADRTAAPAERADSELEILRERQREIMELLGTRTPEKLLHDLRNLINEVNLLRVLMETDEKQ